MGPVSHLADVPDLERHGWRERLPLDEVLHSETWSGGPSEGAVPPIRRVIVEEWKCRSHGFRRTHHMTVPDLADTLPPKTDHPSPPFTLAIDIGGTGLKASVLDSTGAMVADRVKIPTTYPLPPDKLVSDLAKLVQPLPKFDRISVGFPGMVREGHVLTAPHFVLKTGPGSDVDQGLVAKWSDFPLENALSQQLGKPTKVANDADLQGAAVISGHGFELVLTLGTGFGTGIFYDGHLLPHMRIRAYGVPQGRDLQRPARRESS